MSWESVVEAVKSLGLEGSLMIRGESVPTEWGKLLLVPAPGYFEARCGPVRFADIECVRVNPIQTIHRGVRVPPSLIDRSAELSELLATSKASSKIEAGIFEVFGFAQHPEGAGAES